ncbi:hypothetical protein FRB95_009653 [Tulasnella sp. JGI-2019a]|nr:hypothetical protein FRB95_009653 [Tulasnella sp. JGI-2019a]
MSDDWSTALTVAEVQHDQPPPFLPNEVLDHILRKCSRSTLSACCLIDKNLYEIAIVYLYNNPLTFVGTLEGYTVSQARIFGLCRTLAGNHRLADFVRVYDSRVWDVVDICSIKVPQLHGITSAKMHGLPENFRRLCTSTYVQLLSIDGKGFELNEDFKDWLESQDRLRDFKLFSPETQPKVPEIILPKLERLATSFPYAMVILPNAPLIREFYACWLSLEDVDPLFTILAAHCPEIGTVTLSVLIPPDSGSPPPGVRRSRQPRFVFDGGEQDLELELWLFTAVKALAMSCPKLEWVQWDFANVARDRAYRRWKFKHVFVEGSWKTV